MKNFNPIFKEKKVIITGASGFIGSHLSIKMELLGARVYCLVRKKSNIHRLQSIINKVRIIEIDLLNPKDVELLISEIKPNYIFHFAIPSHALLKNTSDLQTQINVTNGHLINLFQSIENKNIKLDSFIHACSGSVYKYDKHNFVLNESTLLSPNTLRGMLKLSQRNLCLFLGKSHKINVKLARIFRAYGPLETNKKLITKSLDSEKNNIPISLGNDKFKRDYIFIDDLIDGILKLALSNLPSGTEMNFGSNSQFSAYEIVSRIEGVLGRKIPKKLNAYPKNLYDQGDFIADCSLAKEKLGWYPMTSIEDGLRQTIDWYRKQH